MYSQIYKLIDYIVNIDYDIFRPANLENWEASLKMFNQKLATIEEDAKLVIDQSIESLRSTEMGVKLIRNINNISTRRCLIDHIHTKYHGIVAKFISELDTVEREFQVREICDKYFTSIPFKCVDCRGTKRSRRCQKINRTSSGPCYGSDYFSSMLRDRRMLFAR